MYLIKIPERKPGIYLILNIATGKAYVGLAEDLKNRTLDHFLAICRTTEGKEASGNSNYLDNKNLIEDIKKGNQKLLHFPLREYKPEDIDNTMLRNVESAYIAIVRDAMQAKQKATAEHPLYNIQKRDIRIEDIVGVDIAAERANLDEIMRKEFDIDFTKFCALTPAEREDLWKELEKKEKFNDKNSNDWIKLTGPIYTSENNFYRVNRNLTSYAFSKSKIRDLGIPWEEISLQDPRIPFTPDPGDDRHRFFAVAKFGIHNQESPYEILKKIQMDMEDSSDHHYYWALANARAIQESVEMQKPSLKGRPPEEWPPVYMIFKITTSDNFASEKKTNEQTVTMEMTMTEEEIRAKDAKLSEENALDLKHSYFDPDQNRWRSLPEGLTYVTIASGNNKGIEYRTSALRIGEIFVCKEYPENDIFYTVVMSVTKNSQNPGQQVLFWGEFSDPLPKLEVDDRALLVCRLDYPYTVPLSHISTLENYLGGKDRGKNEKRVLLEMQLKKNLEGRTPVLRGYVFEGKKVWVHDFNTTYDNGISKGTTEDIADYIQDEENGVEGSYTVENGNTICVCVKDKVDRIELEPSAGIFRNSKEESGNYVLCGFQSRTKGSTYFFHYRRFCGKQNYTPPFVFTENENR